MTMPATPSNPKPADQAAVPHPVDSFAEKLNQTWQTNRNAIFIGCALVLLGILGKGGYEVYQNQRQEKIAQEFAAATTPEKLKAFAAANAGHELSGVAYLQLADDAHKAGQFAEAAALYEQSLAALRDQPFAGRARMGSAVSKVLAGKSVEGEIALKQLADDAKQLKGIRAEAAYHLLRQAVDAGRQDEVKTYFDQITQIDATGVWAQRAMMLRASLPATEPAKPAAPAAATEGISLKVPGKN